MHKKVLIDFNASKENYSYKLCNENFTNNFIFGLKGTEGGMINLFLIVIK